MRRIAPPGCAAEGEPLCLLPRGNQKDRLHGPRLRVLRRQISAEATFFTSCSVHSGFIITYAVRESRSSVVMHISGV